MKMMSFLPIILKIRSVMSNSGQQLQTEKSRSVKNMSEVNARTVQHPNKLILYSAILFPETDKYDIEKLFHKREASLTV